MVEALLFDSHCHLDDAQFDQDREALVASLPSQGIAFCMTVGSSLDSSRANIALAQQHSFLYAAAGVHPHVAAEAPEDYLDQLRLLLRQDKVQALGEIGLDFHYDFSPREVQERLLHEQLDLAYELGLPVILHVREAHGAMTELLRGRAARLPRGVIHCYSGSYESALEYLRLGMDISFAGSLTFKKAEKLHESARALPLDRILIETDSPYLSPVPERGKRNNPAKVAHVCAFLAQLRGIPYEEAARATRDNALRLFQIS